MELSKLVRYYSRVFRQGNLKMNKNKFNIYVKANTIET